MQSAKVKKAYFIAHWQFLKNILRLYKSQGCIAREKALKLLTFAGILLGFNAILKIQNRNFVANFRLAKGVTGDGSPPYIHYFRKRKLLTQPHHLVR